MPDQAERMTLDEPPEIPMGSHGGGDSLWMIRSLTPRKRKTLSTQPSTRYTSSEAERRWRKPIPTCMLPLHEQSSETLPVPLLPLSRRNSTPVLSCGERFGSSDL